jgi:hypothetical protein
MPGREGGGGIDIVPTTVVPTRRRVDKYPCKRISTDHSSYLIEMDAHLPTSSIILIPQ